MNGRTHRTGVTQRLLTSLLATGACLAVVAQPAFPGDSRSASSEQTQTEAGASVPQLPAEKPAAVSGGTAGMMIHIDPQTGEILKGPVPGTVPLPLPPTLRRALSTSHQGLFETPSPVPGGGVKVDLQGRFQSPVFATIDANGKLKLQHLHEIPEPGDKK